MYGGLNHPRMVERRNKNHRAVVEKVDASSRGSIGSVDPTRTVASPLLLLGGRRADDDPSVVMWFDGDG